MDENEIFPLASGKKSRYYVDCKATTMRAVALPIVGELLCSYIQEEVDAIGGLTMGADPLSMAASYYSATARRNINSFSVRKEPKKHGMKKWIEGCVKSGDRVIVVDDVVTTGGSTITAIKHCEDEGLSVVGVIVLVDREEENGFANIKKIVPNVPVRSIVTITELLNAQ